MQRITFFILNTNGSPVRQITVSKLFLFFLAFMFFSGIGLAGYGAYDYYNTKIALLNAKELEKKISYQTDEIIVQRKQIQKFAGEINSLKTNLLALNDFQKQIRIIAGIEISEDENNLFGIGGSIPDDLNEKLDLTEKHNSLIREMHEQAEQIDLAIANQKQGFGSILKHLDKQKNLLAATPAIRPTRGIITSRFGKRKSPFTNMTEFHEGLDIANVKGTPIVATADGIITYAAEKGSLGRVVIIDHGHGLVTRYAHTDEILKKQGDTVKRGEVVALMGDTGRSTGSHLHYEVYLNGVPINPEKYILN